MRCAGAGRGGAGAGSAGPRSTRWNTDEDGPAQRREATDTLMMARMGALHTLLVVLVLSLLSDGAVAKISQNRLYSDDMILESRE